MKEEEMNAAVRVKNLKKSYGGNEVLKGFDLEIERGEIFALLGKNGAGKTTALECIEGLKKFDCGQISVKGKMGIQTQNSSLPAHIKALEALRLFASWRGSEPDRTAIERLGISELEKKQYGQLSTGQKRRLHLAIALIGDPDVIFLDEPTAGLDVQSRLALHEQIRDLKTAGKTIILASHDMAEVEDLCDRIGILIVGKLAFCGTPYELTERIGEKFFIRIKTIAGDRSFETDDIEASLSAVLTELKQKKIKVLDIRVDRGTLERHFIDISGRE